MRGLARGEQAPWRREPSDTPPSDAPSAVHSRSRRAAASRAPLRATTPPPPPARLGRGSRARGQALAAIAEAASEGPEAASPPPPRRAARPAAAAVRAADAAAPLHAATAAALALPFGGGGGASAAVAPLRRKRKAPDALGAGPLAQLAAFFQQVDDTELPEEPEASRPAGEAPLRAFKKARRPQREPDTAALQPLAAAALATPSPARAVAMYPSLSTDFDAYAKALPRGVAPMAFDAFVAMMTSRRRQGADASPPAAQQPPPRLAAALLATD